MMVHLRTRTTLAVVVSLVAIVWSIGPCWCHSVKAEQEAVAQACQASHHHHEHCDNSDDFDDNVSSRSPPSGGWNPDDEHPCTIERLKLSEFMNRFGPQGGLPPLYPHPLVVVLDDVDNDDNDEKVRQSRNQDFRDITRRDAILQSFPINFTVTLSSSNSFSEHRRVVPLKQYLDVTTTNRLTPDLQSNETWYLFGETYSSDWKRLLEIYQVPPCRACVRESMQDDPNVHHHRHAAALSFGIGGWGSGVQWHVHGPGWSEAVQGRKHWVMYEPDRKPAFHPDQTSFHWMYYDYPNLSLDERPWECTLQPGDLVYFPDMWWHATINLDDYTAFISTFTQDHLVAKQEEFECS